jgi:hypothetical protein
MLKGLSSSGAWRIYLVRFLLGMLFSAIGAGYFLYGRKERSSLYLLLGVLLVAYPYFVSSLVLLLLIGVLLSAVPVAIHRGWI